MKSWKTQYIHAEKYEMEIEIGEADLEQLYVCSTFYYN